jgi:hypothetical protein
MRVAITGAGGFIGRALVPELLKDGHSIIALSRDPAAIRERFGPSVEVRQWSPNANSVFPSCDAVIHLAGESVAGRWMQKKKRSIYDSRIQGTRALISSMERMEDRPKILLCASAVGYYGHRGDEWLAEDAPPGTDFLAQVCRDWEAEAQEAVEWGARIVRLRLGIVLGRGGGALAPMKIPFQLGLGAKLGDGRQWMSWIHLSDTVGLFRYVMETPTISGPVNAVSPEPVRNAEFTQTLAKALHRPAFFTLPGWAVKLAVGEMAESLLNGQRVMPDVALKSGYSFRYPTLESALDEIFSTGS